MNEILKAHLQRVAKEAHPTEPKDSNVVNREIPAAVPHKNGRTEDEGVMAWTIIDHEPRRQPE